MTTGEARRAPSPAVPRDALPLVPGPWKRLGDADSLAFIRLLDRHLQARGQGDAIVALHRLRDLRVVPLSFYPGWVLVEGEADTADRHTGTLDALLGPGFLWCLDGRTAPLYVLNQGAMRRAPRPGADGPDDGDRIPSPLARLDDPAVAADYLRFFCNQMRGDEGTFRVVESADDLRRCGVPEPAASLADEVAPVLVEPDADGDAGDQVATMAIVYGGTLMRARVRVQPDGIATMLDDDVVQPKVAPPEQFRPLLRHVRRPCSTP